MNTIWDHDIAGLSIPDSAIARQATQLVRDTESEVLFLHSMRVYAWGALAGKRKRMTFDAELLYVAAMFHDLGLTELFRQSALRFEVDGANAAAAFLRTHGIPEREIEKVWNAIALHTTPGIPQFMQPEVALLQVGAGMDVAGRTHDEFPLSEREAVTAAWPRADNFGTVIIDAFYDGLKHRPGSTFGTFNDDFLAYKDPTFRRGDICTIILHSPWVH
jgi:hypothetical protein